MPAARGTVINTVHSPAPEKQRARRHPPSDAGFGMQVSIEDDLRDSREVTLQAALLYTSSKGERRIRVHTLCLPTSASVSDIINSADQQAVIGMLAKFGKQIFFRAK